MRALADENPAARTRALADLDPDADASLLAGLAADDPNQGVRAAAVEHLADGDSAAVVVSLLRALHDPDRQVIFAALDALEFAADESVIPQIEPLRSHHDPAVRKRAASAIEMLR